MSLTGVLLEHRQSFVNCLWLPLGFQGRAEELWQRVTEAIGPTEPKYLLSGPLQEKRAVWFCVTLQTPPDWRITDWWLLGGGGGAQGTYGAILRGDKMFCVLIVVITWMYEFFTSHEMLL
jgi:hypothetical protein